jgi:SAM-dependent methyltransferase
MVTPALPLPKGWSVDQIRETMDSFSIDGSPEGALAGYSLDSMKRFLYTWGLVKDLEGSALELGANPYFATWLFRDFTKLDLTLANYFGSDVAEGSQPVTYTAQGEKRGFTADFKHFNIELGTYPFPEKSFDVVLFCEILEHLQHDPTHPLREINRVLKDDGVLIMTTPNAAEAAKLVAMIQGHSVWDQYSGHGVYGRHSREYSFGEAHRIVEHTGFKVENAFTADSYPFQHPKWLYSRSLRKLLGDRERQRALGQYTFIRARKIAAPTPGLPSWLFRDFPAERMSAEG